MKKIKDLASSNRNFPRDANKKVSGEDFVNEDTKKNNFGSPIYQEIHESISRGCWDRSELKLVFKNSFYMAF